MHTSRIGSSRRRHRSGAENLASEILFYFPKKLYSNGVGFIEQLIRDNESVQRIWRKIYR